MRFKTYSLSDEDLQDLLPWLEENLGTLDKGEEWIIGRNKDGGVSAQIVSGGRVKTNRVIPTTVAPKEPEKYVDPWEGFTPAKKTSTPEPPVEQPVETEEETTKPAVVKGQRDFRRPSSIRRQPTSTEPVISRRQPTSTEPVISRRQPTSTEPAISRRQPTSTEPVISRRRDTDDATQQVISKRRPTMSSGASSTKAREAKASARYKSPVVPMEEDLPSVIDPKESGNVSKSSTAADSPFTIVDSDKIPARWKAMGVTEEEEKPKNKGKNLFGKVGGAVAGAAKGVAGMFDGEDEDAPPAWINDPGVGVSPPGLLRATARRMAMNRGDGYGGYGSFAAQEYWTDPKDGTTYMRYKPEEEELPSEVDMTDATPDVKEKTDPTIKIESERFEGTPPENLDTEETPQLEIDLEDPVIIDQLTNPKTPVPVDNPEPIELPVKTKADEKTDTFRVKDNPVASDMVIQTQEAIGADWKSPTGQIVVTTESFEEQASPEPEPPYRIQINPNTNIAKLFDSQGIKIKEYAVGTGDTTGTRYGGRKFFTPTGTAEIINKVSYDKIEGSYGPVWMGLDWDSYGLHGPHAAKDVKETGTGFKNQGFVSHGCVRFMEKDLLDLANYLQVGSSVEVLPYTTRPLNRGPLRVGAK